MGFKFAKDISSKSNIFVKSKIDEHKKNKIKLPRLYYKIMFDRKFSELSGYAGVYKTKLSKKEKIKIMGGFFLYLFQPKKLYSVVLVRDTMFINILISKFDLWPYKKILKVNNFSTYEKIIAHFFVLILLKRRKKIITKLSSEDIDLYKIYLLNVVHAMRVKKRVKGKFFYHGNGSPSYGSFIFSDFYEIQHGVLYEGHPAVFSKFPRRGGLIVSSVFYINVSQLQKNIFLIDDFFKKRKGEVENCAYNLVKEVYDLVILPGLPESELIIEDRFAVLPSVKFLYHPKSQKYTFRSAEETICLIENSKEVYVGNSTAINDLHLLGKDFTVIINDFDLKILGLDKDDGKVRESLEALYCVKDINVKFI